LIEQRELDAEVAAGKLALEEKMIQLAAMLHNN
jgi:hypothetical protein